MTCSASQRPLQVPENFWLRPFVEWLHANGVTGLIQPDAKLALYEAERKAGPTERGLIFTEVRWAILLHTRMLCCLMYPRDLSNDSLGTMPDCDTAS